MGATGFALALAGALVSIWEAHPKAPELVDTGVTLLMGACFLWVVYLFVYLFTDMGAD